MNPLSVGQNTVIYEGVTFGENVIIGNNVVIYEETVIENNVIIQDNAVIGKQPVRAKNSALPPIENKLTPARIGSGVTVGTSSIIYASAEIANEVFIADLATVRERVKVGGKTIVGRGVSIENDCLIGEKCKLETNCYITAYSTLEDYVFVAPCVVTTNDNYMARTKERFKHFKGITIKRGGRIGANTTILPGKVIGEDSAIGAGSIVTKDVPDGELVIGTPAKRLRDVPKEQLLNMQS